MIYPTAKTKEEFNKLWYDAQGFGTKTNYGYHEANDINMRTGGNTDLGKDLLAVDDGKIVYFHLSKHPNNGFGKHMVLEVETSKGKKWFHYAHCDAITAKEKDVKKGEVIGKLGKSGTQFAHLHFAMFVVDPQTLAQGIDEVANTLAELNRNWGDALKFIDSHPDDDCKETKEKYEKLVKDHDEVINDHRELQTKHDKLKEDWIKKEKVFEALDVKHKALELSQVTILKDMELKNIEVEALRKQVKLLEGQIANAGDPELNIKYQKELEKNIVLKNQVKALEKDIAIIAKHSVLEFLFNFYKGKEKDVR